jgi:hypothetical protein
MRILVAALLAGLAGCGYTGANPTNIIQVSGKAVGPDGQPAKYVTLNFVPLQTGGAPAFGFVGADGTFTPKTLNNQDGIVPGAYKVAVEPVPSKGTPVAQRNTSEFTTDLRVEVGPNDSQLKVQLK